MDINNYIAKDECSIVLEGIGRRGYVNSNYGRNELRKDCEEHNALDVYNEVISIWGESSVIAEEDEANITIEDVRSEKISELEDAFNTAVKGSFVTTEGYKMQFNIDDSIKMTGAIQVMEDTNSETGYITDADDETHYDITLAVMKSVKSQMLKQYSICHLKKQQYRAAIKNASTIEELNSIIFKF